MAVLIDDNISIIGSFNADMRSAYLDTELMLCIESTEINKELSDIMGEVKEQCKHTISMDTFTLPENVNTSMADKSRLCYDTFYDKLKAID